MISASGAAVLIIDNFVSASDASALGAAIWHHILTHSQQQLVRVNRQSSACIWPFHGRMQHVWHHIQSSVHLIVSRSDAVFLTSTACLLYSLVAASHSFERFFYVIEKPLIGPHTHSFDQVFLEKCISHQHSIKIIFISYAAYAISAKDLRDRDNQSASKHVFYISANDHFNVSSNGHFKRSFQTVISNGHFVHQTDQNSVSFHFIYDQFFNFSTALYFLFQVQRSRHSRTVVDVHQIEETTSRIKRIKRKKS